MELFRNGDIRLRESRKAVSYLTDEVSYVTASMSVRKPREKKTMADAMPWEVEGKLGGPAGNEIRGELQGFYLWEPFLVLGMAVKPL